MREIVSHLDRYTGVDIVRELITHNTATYADARVRFIRADIAADPLPRADMVMCRDCLIHLPTRTIERVLRNFRRSGATYLLLSSESTEQPYHDIPTGSFRNIDFTQPPFDFPPPADSILERGPDRRLCLWRLTSLPI